MLSFVYKYLHEHSQADEKNIVVQRVDRFSEPWSYEAVKTVREDWVTRRILDMQICMKTEENSGSW